MGQVAVVSVKSDHRSAEDCSNAPGDLSLARARRPSDSDQATRSCCGLRQVTV
jgi:hypothetical protein